jgi:hypothetical protein
MIAEWMEAGNNHDKQQVVYLRPVFRGTRDGFSLDDFFGRVSDLKNTIFFCKVRGSNHCFGAYNKVGYRQVMKGEDN